MARWNLENLAHADKAPVTEDTYDPVEKPAHYNLGGVECIDYIEQVLGLDGVTRTVSSGLTGLFLRNG